MIRIGIIGCGKIAQVRHIPEYAENENAVLTAYYDFDMQRANEVAKKYGGEVYASAEELLANQEIDAVSICVPNNMHAEFSIKALEAGKHVLCEKPMAISLSDCEAMVEAARVHSRFLMIGQQQRLTKTHQKAKRLLEQGYIGDIISFKTTFGHSGPESWSIDSGKESWFFNSQRAGMGVMADLGVHKTDLIQFLLGENIVETTARIITLEKKDAKGKLIGVDDNAFCIYKTRSGIVGIMNASWTYYGQENNSTVIYGTNGIMKIYDNPQFSIEVITKDQEHIMFEIDSIQANDKQTKSYLIDEFILSLMKNEEPSISGRNVISAMRVIFASFESSDTNQMVKILQNY